MLKELNQKLKKSAKIMTKWQEYIEEEQCIETVGSVFIFLFSKLFLSLLIFFCLFFFRELMTVIKHPDSWKEFTLPAICKIGIETVFLFLDTF